MEKQITLNVKGMTCQMCVKHVTKALRDVSGVSDVKVTLEEGIANLVYNPEVAAIEQFKTAVADAGYEVID